ncbi:tyrosine-type recombinase/integrase [Paenibacillus chitinolyticus]|uniref:tyrosine-type recombinase/integrase n=1 Tax=Paenibacillus chitinolyticus TaxID=79263 RepID=UPI0036D8BFFC
MVVPGRVYDKELDKKDTSPFYPNRLGRHYSLSSLSSSLTAWMKEAGLVTTQNQRVTPHYLRHYFAQAAFAAGAPIGHIAETLGHSLERTTKENYLRNSLKKQHDVSELVDIRLTT